MMEILAKLIPATGKFDVYLNGAPPNSICEVRWQNTMSGGVQIETVDVGAKGSVKLSILRYGQHLSPTVRVLSDTNDIDIVSFAYQSDESDNLRLVQTGESKTPIVKPQPQEVTEQPQTVEHNTLPEESKG
jgi:hypothetical protein